jgi:hypothetical protein
MGRARLALPLHDQQMIMAAAPPILTLDPAGEREMARLQAKMRAYATATGKSAEGVMSKKLADVAMRLTRLFRIHRSGRLKRTKVWNEFARRSKANKEGIKVRTDLLSRKTTDRRGRTLSNWQRRVGRELNRRASGSGFLASQFRLLHTKHGGPMREGSVHRVRRDRSMNVSAAAWKDSTEAVLDLRTPGTREMNRRYGMIPRALRMETADIELYLRYKQGLIAKDTMVARGKSARAAAFKAYRHSITHA